MITTNKHFPNFISATNQRVSKQLLSKNRLIFIFRFLIKSFFLLLIRKINFIIFLPSVYECDACFLANSSHDKTAIRLYSPPSSIVYISIVLWRFKLFHVNKLLSEFWLSSFLLLKPVGIIKFCGPQHSGTYMRNLIVILYSLEVQGVV